jgi:hypothetical protein
VAAPKGLRRRGERHAAPGCVETCCPTAVLP